MTDHQKAAADIAEREADEAEAELFASTGPVEIEHLYRIVDHSVHRIAQVLREWE